MYRRRLLDNSIPLSSNSLRSRDLSLEHFCNLVVDTMSGDQATYWNLVLLVRTWKVDGRSMGRNGNRGKVLHRG